MHEDSPQEASSGGATLGLPVRKRLQKVPLNTYVRPATQQRVEVLKGRGYAVTDIVDTALNEFLDRAGVPPASD
ncbi:hypothetical protein OKHIL_75910 [Mycolicibacterium mageritense]